VDILGFDAKLLCLSASIISPIITKFINASLNTAIVPPDWKLACVAPVYKGKGNMYEKGNYRPISVIAHIANIFEIQVQKPFLSYLLDTFCIIYIYIYIYMYILL
jgi:hypothetical protein